MVVSEVFFSCSGAKIIGRPYFLNDIPMRNLSLLLNKDSTYILVNRKEGSFFSSAGKWTFIDKKTYLLLNPSCINAKCDTTNRAVKQDEKIDYDKMQNIGTPYLFPTIMVDSIRFSSNFRYLVLKGFRFSQTR